MEGCTIEVTGLEFGFQDIENRTGTVIGSKLRRDEKVKRMSDERQREAGDGRERRVHERKKSIVNICCYFQFK